MIDSAIVLTKEEYAELLRASERIAAVERLFESTQYATAQDVAAILGIEREVYYELQ